MTDNLEKLKYPIGRYESPLSIDQTQISIWIDEIKALPQMLNDLCSRISEESLDTPYRPDGWTCRQVIHHIGESHMNSFIRFKWALTEDTPTIKAYHEDRWAELPDSKKAPIDYSLHLIESLHQKWTYLLETLDVEDYGRSFIHPEMNKEITLGWTLGLYAWHGEHHYQHINQTIMKNEK